MPYLFFSFFFYIFSSVEYTLFCDHGPPRMLPTNLVKHQGEKQQEE